MALRVGKTIFIRHVHHLMNKSFAHVIKSVYLCKLKNRIYIAMKIQFDSLINIRPHQCNRSRDVQDPAVRKQIVDLVNTLIR
jgi:hypothetical protein